MKFLKTLTWTEGIPEDITIERIEIPSQEFDVYLAGIWFKTPFNSVGFIKISRIIQDEQIDFFHLIKYLPEKNKIIFDDLNLKIKDFWKKYTLNESPKITVEEDSYYLEIPSEYDVELKLDNYIYINHKRQGESVNYLLADLVFDDTNVSYKHVYLSVNNEPEKLIAIVHEDKSKTNTEIMFQLGQTTYITFKNIKYINSLKIFLTDTIGSTISTSGTCVLHFISK